MLFVVTVCFFNIVRFNNQLKQFIFKQTVRAEQQCNNNNISISIEYQVWNNFCAKILIFT